MHLAIRAGALGRLAQDLHEQRERREDEKYVSTVQMTHTRTFDAGLPERVGQPTERGPAGTRRDMSSGRLRGAVFGDRHWL